MTGNFTICNPTNTSINQTIIFPFFIHYIDTDKVGRDPHPHIINFSVDGSELSIIYLDDYDVNHYAISCNITIGSYGEQTIFLKYKTHYGLIGNLECQLVYYQRTAQEWGHSINYSYFKFIFDNSSIKGDPKGGDKVSKENGFIVTTIERDNLTPNEDIIIRWTSTKNYHSDDYDSYDTEENNQKDDEEKDNIFTPLFSIIIVIVAIGIYLFIRRRKVLRSK